MQCAKSEQESTCNRLVRQNENHSRGVGSFRLDENHSTDILNYAVQVILLVVDMRLCSHETGVMKSPKSLEPKYAMTAL